MRTRHALELAGALVLASCQLLLGIDDDEPGATSDSSSESGSGGVAGGGEAGDSGSSGRGGSDGHLGGAGGDGAITGGAGATATGGAGRETGGSSTGGNITGGAAGGGSGSAGGGSGGRAGGGSGGSAGGGSGGSAGGGSGGSAGGGSGGNGECGVSPPDMVCVPGGAFEMGGEADSNGGTLPFHTVTVRTFHIDRTEVTTNAFEVCIVSGDCLDAPRGSSENPCNVGVLGTGDHPVNCVTWTHASQFCRSVGKRLPTEEEWVYAARRGTRAYPWGDTLPDATRGNVAGGGDGFARTSPVGSFPAGATPDGIVDLFGNVWEWVSSPFCPYPTSPCTSCLPSESCADACSDCDSSARVHRGRSFADDFQYDVDNPFHSQLDWRGWGANAIDAWAAYIGFRCAL